MRELHDLAFKVGDNVVILHNDKQEKCVGLTGVVAFCMLSASDDDPTYPYAVRLDRPISDCRYAICKEADIARI